MSDVVLWVAIVAAGLVCLGIKLVGHLVPEHWLAEPRVARAAALVTVALLSALVAVQAATTG
ncbi:AzlD domain-containing protein, partial [Cellulomonas septica]|nr:AzlD domain-containing protein [Cellulomonas septica]